MLLTLYLDQRLQSVLSVGVLGTTAIAQSLATIFTARSRQFQLPVGTANLAQSFVGAQ